MSANPPDVPLLIQRSLRLRRWAGVAVAALTLTSAFVWPRGRPAPRPPPAVAIAAQTSYSFAEVVESDPLARLVGGGVVPER